MAVSVDSITADQIERVLDRAPDDAEQYLTVWLAGDTRVEAMPNFPGLSHTWYRDIYWHHEKPAYGNMTRVHVGLIRFYDWLRTTRNRMHERDMDIVKDLISILAADGGLIDFAAWGTRVTSTYRMSPAVCDHANRQGERTRVFDLKTFDVFNMLCFIRWDVPVLRDLDVSVILEGYELIQTLTEAQDWYTFAIKSIYLDEVRAVRSKTDMIRWAFDHVTDRPIKRDLINFLETSDGLSLFKMPMLEVGNVYVGLSMVRRYIKEHSHYFGLATTFSMGISAETSPDALSGLGVLWSAGADDAPAAHYSTRSFASADTAKLVTQLIRQSFRSGRRVEFRIPVPTRVRELEFPDEENVNIPTPLVLRNDVSLKLSTLIVPYTVNDNHFSVTDDLHSWFTFPRYFVTRAEIPLYNATLQSVQNSMATISVHAKDVRFATIDDFKFVSRRM
jgi:hypothetical protein